MIKEYMMNDIDFGFVDDFEDFVNELENKE